MSEAYVMARNAGNLSQNPERLVPVDWLTAAGMSGQQGTLGSLLMSALAEHDGAGIKSETRNALISQVLALAIRRGVGHQLANTVLLWWLDPLCEDCHGRGYQVVPGTNRLSDTQCPSCHGVGKREIPGGDVGKDFAEELSQHFHRHRSRLTRKMVD